MSFQSLEWAGWMWLTVSLYWLAPRDARPWLLMALSLAFLVSAAPLSAALLVAFTAITHLATNVLQPGFRSVALASAVLIAVLAAFKIGQTVQADMLVDTLLIPLGLSYYAFRCVHFMIERYKGRVPRTTPKQLAGYLFFLPTFVVGPIHRFDDFDRDTRRQRFDAGLLSLGFERILQGYAKIVILSNYGTETLLGGYIAGLADQDSAFTIYLGIVKDGLNLYFQFSGHSDIAIGFAMMLGYRVMENFNWPYLQPNISAFWQSWHRSLSRWCREYIYAVVVAQTRSPALGALSTMVVIGLWHEISLRFLLWGAYHGIGIIIWQRFQDLRQSSSLTIPQIWQGPLHVLSVILTVNFVWFGFVILTAPSAGEALALFGRFAKGF